MADQHLNFAYSLVATAPSPASSGTSLVVTAGQGVLFPVPPFQATIWATGAAAISTNAEIVTVTNLVTDTLTIVRAQEGSTARTVVVGDQIAATITAKSLTDAEQVTPSTGAANTLTIAAGNQLMCARRFSNRGHVVNRGQMVVL